MAASQLLPEKCRCWSSSHPTCQICRGAAYCAPAKNILGEGFIMAHLAQICVYPIKSLAPVSPPNVTLLTGGALEHDREFALFTEDGKVLNGKRTPRIHSLRSAFDLATGILCVEAAGSGEEAHFRLPDEWGALEGWLTRFFDQPVAVRRSAQGGFPDDLNAAGPTIISTATLEEVASWFPGLSVESARIRFRANLEVGGVPPFWEDRLFGEAESVLPFQIGNVAFHGVNPCQRCIVPPRDPETGEAIPNFSNIFRAKREETLPPWAVRARFNHFYRLAVNTRVPVTEAGKMLRVGDSVRV
jgi:uncharacterized protein YcbX